MFYKITLAIYAAFILGAASIATAEDVTSQKKRPSACMLPMPPFCQKRSSLFPLRYAIIHLPNYTTATLSPIHSGHERIYSVEKDGNWEKIINFQTAAVLKPAETATWYYHDVPSELLKTMWFFQGVKSLQAKFLIGPNQWISSNIVPIRRAEPDKKPVVVLEPDYIGTRKTSLKKQFYKISIKGKDYLFYSKSYRICEIPKGCTPELTWEPRLGLLKITFSAANRPPQTIWYSIKKVRTLNSSQLTDYYREAYNFKYGDADYKQRALKGMASHGTEVSLQSLNQYKGSNKPRLKPVTANPDSKMPKISPDLSSLSNPDIQTLARDTLSRFVSTHARNRTFRLARLEWTSFI